MKSIWRRIAESTEGPTVTFTLPRDTARDLLVALGDSLEVDIDLDALEDDGGMGDEPDADDMGGPPDGDADDLGGGGLDNGMMDIDLGDLGVGGDEDDMPAGDIGDDDDDGGAPPKKGPGRPPGPGKKKPERKPEPDDDDDEGDDDDGDDKDEAADPYLGESSWQIAEKHIGFKKMTQKFADKGFDNPAGAAYKVGVEKYGKRGMAAKAAAGRRKG